MKQVKRPRRSTVISAGLASVVCLALTGCSDEPEPRAGGGESSTSSRAPSSETSNDAEEAQRGEASGQACLTGTWLADNDYFLASIREFGDEIKDVSGEVTVTFAEDTSMTTVYDEWLISAVADGLPTTIHRDGTDTGSFTASDTTISMKEAQMGSALEVTAAGHSMTVPAEPVDYADAVYTCSTTTASITTPDGSLQLTRR